MLTISTSVILCVALLLVSCSNENPTDPTTQSGLSSITGTLSTTVGTSSTAVTSSTTISTSSSNVFSSAVLVSSSSVASSSTTTVSQNTQTCPYTAITATTGKIECAEQNYTTVTIGGVKWMAKNLNYGSRIENASDQTNDEKYCYLDDVNNCNTDGGLYQWAEAMSLPNSCNYTTCANFISSRNHKGICPTGWHIPKASEWAALIAALGGSSTVGVMMKLNNTGFSSWDAIPYNDGHSSGFSALPAGNRGDKAYFWEPSEGYASSDAYSHGLASENAALFTNYFYNFKTYGFSVRCVEDRRCP